MNYKGDLYGKVGKGYMKLDQDSYYVDELEIKLREAYKAIVLLQKGDMSVKYNAEILIKGLRDNKEQL